MSEYISHVKNLLKNGGTIKNENLFSTFQAMIDKLQEDYKAEEDGFSFCISLLYNVPNCENAFLYYDTYNDFETAKEKHLEYTGIGMISKVRNASALYVKSDGRWKEMIYTIC